MGVSDGRVVYRKAEHLGLSLSVGHLPGDFPGKSYLDIYAPGQPPGRAKVFSIRYGSIPLDVVTFKPGSWREGRQGWHVGAIQRSHRPGGIHGYHPKQRPEEA